MAKSQTILLSRLTEAREELGLSKTDLAKKINMTLGAISQYENGNSTPSPSALSKIALTLGKPIEFFYNQPDRDYLIASPISFRKLSSATMKNRRIADIKILHTNDILEKIFEVISPQASNIPFEHALIDEAALLALEDEDIENIAYAIRKDWGIGFRPIENFTILLENNGIVCLYIGLPAWIDGFSYWLKCHNEDSLLPIVIINSQENYFRQRFDLGHELAHLVLHRLLESDIIEKYSKLIEKQAHRFASAFLMPPEEFSNSVKIVSMNSLIPLKEYWGVSMAAIMRRMYDLGLLDENKYKLWNIELSRKKIKRVEPGDKDIEQEKSSFIEQAMSFICTNNLGTIDDFYKSLWLPFEEMYDYTKNEMFIKRTDSANILQFKPKYYKEAREEG